MSSPDRPFTGKLVSFADGKPRLFCSLLCDGVTAYDLPSSTALLALHARLQREHPDMRVLASLDDLAQAAYTCGHVVSSRGLDDVDGHDLSMVDPALFVDGEHPGYLSTPEEFPIRLANLDRMADGVDWQAIVGQLDWDTGEEETDPLSIHRDPDGAARLVGDGVTIFQFVPVDRAADGLAAFPNGYFQCDLSPAHNLALARHLEERFDLALFGVGASFLGFRRALPFDADTARDIAGLMGRLYAGASVQAVADLATLLIGRTWLLVRYTES